MKDDEDQQIEALRDMIDKLEAEKTPQLKQQARTQNPEVSLLARKKLADIDSQIKAKKTELEVLSGNR